MDNFCPCFLNIDRFNAFDFASIIYNTILFFTLYLYLKILRLYITEFLTYIIYIFDSDLVWRMQLMIIKGQKFVLIV